jgi:hypothetical protein
MMTFAARKAMAWFEYVPSKENLADGGKRDDIDTAALGFEIVKTPLPPSTDGVVNAPPRVWLEWLKLSFDTKSSASLQSAYCFKQSICDVLVNYCHQLHIFSASKRVKASSTMQPYRGWVVGACS